MDSLLRIFPQKRRAFWQKTADNGEKICEIRLRVDRPVIVETSRGDYFLNNGGEWQEHPYGAHLVTEAEIRELIAWLCQDSVYAYADEIRQGFLTVEGGHRIGLCGQAVLENETVIRTLKNISFINIRVAHEIRGAADGILPKLYKKGKFQNTLIVSPPEDCPCGRQRHRQNHSAQGSDPPDFRWQYVWCGTSGGSGGRALGAGGKLSGKTSE